MTTANDRHAWDEILVELSDATRAVQHTTQAWANAIQHQATVASRARQLAPSSNDAFVSAINRVLEDFERMPGLLLNWHELNDLMNAANTAYDEAIEALADKSQPKSE